jgi:hypothetical protein
MSDSQPVRASAGIHCAGCGRPDDSDEPGWKAYPVTATTGGDEVLVFCPQCAAREFADDA